MNVVASGLCAVLTSIVLGTKIASRIEYWIEHVLREQFTTVDELVECFVHPMGEARQFLLLRKVLQGVP